jgi:hypothetical protein
MVRMSAWIADETVYFVRLHNIYFRFARGN